MHKRKALLRAAKREVDDAIRTRRLQRDEEGRVVVRMTVKDDSDFLSAFSQSDMPVISTDVAEFIEHSTDAVPPVEPLTLCIHSDCIDEGEEADYRAAIKAYYTEKYMANERELRRNRFIVLALTLAGILVLSLALLLEYRFDSRIWAEVIDIVAWVLLWEAVDIGVFQGRALKIARMRSLAFLSMKIEYES